MKCKKCGSEIKDGNKFCTSCGTPVETTTNSDTKEILTAINNTQFKNESEYKTPKTRRIFKILGIIILVIIVISIAINSSDSNSSTSQNNDNSSVVSNTQTGDQTQPTQQAVNTYDQNKIAASVVNILCPDGDNGSGGSGTIFDSRGYILTNAHIIPQDSDGNPIPQECIVTLPDPSTGKIDSIFQGEPIIIPTLSKEYDLAIIKINEVFTDDQGKVDTPLPVSFPSFFPDGCENDNPTLGEQVHVFGYPAISAGGYYLTITDGTVSTLPNDGTIYTSAKVDHGDSGGLAVDENGCMLGVPSEISTDGSESLGIIYSNSIVGEFIDKLNTLEDSQNQSSN